MLALPLALAGRDAPVSNGLSEPPHVQWLPQPSLWAAPPALELASNEQPGVMPIKTHPYAQDLQRDAANPAQSGRHWLKDACGADGKALCPWLYSLGQGQPCAATAAGAGDGAPLAGGRAGGRAAGRKTCQPHTSLGA